MAMNVFQFLDDDEFAKLEGRARAGYLVRASQELIRRQDILRDQMRRTVGIVDTEATIPVDLPSSSDESSTPRLK